MSSTVIKLYNKVKIVEHTDSQIVVGFPQENSTEGC